MSEHARPTLNRTVEDKSQTRSLHFTVMATGEYAGYFPAFQSDPPLCKVNVLGSIPCEKISVS